MGFEECHACDEELLQFCCHEGDEQGVDWFKGRDHLRGELHIAASLVSVELFEFERMNASAGSSVGKM